MRIRLQPFKAICSRPKAIILLFLVHFNMTGEIDKSHDIAQLLLLGELSEFLLVVQWDLVVLISGDPGVLEGGRCVVPLRRWIRA